MRRLISWLGALIITAFAVFAGVLILAVCDKAPTTPQPPEPASYYTLEYAYTRVGVVDVKKLVDTPGVCFDLYGGGNYDRVLDSTRVNDYNFTGRLNKKYAAGTYCILAYDPARYDGVDKGTNLVGYKFTLKVVETGFTQELAKIMVNTMQGFPDANSSSTMARFMLKKDGTFIDY
ncbi:MAG: hypothetical protein ABSF88_01250 [Candidatus Aminicenantales bacterium]